MGSEAQRVVMITGADGGLGGTVTNAFLKSGATVIAVSNSIGGTSDEPCLVPVRADLTSREGARGAVQAALDHSGRLDVLVHLVGGFAGGSRVDETEDALWEKMVNLNLNTAFHAIRAALPSMRAAGRGRIVAVGSRTGIDLSAGYAAYGVSKAALHALVRTVALEGKDAGITANVVVPSIIDTPLNRKEMPDADFSKWVTPASLASVIQWLASDEAGDVSGALIPVYGRS